MSNMIMSPQERIDSIEGIASVLGQADASHVWDVVTHEKNGRPASRQLMLTVESGGKTWKICSADEPREAAEKMCTEYLLRKMAHAAHLCHRCLSKVPRLPADPKTNKTQRKLYRCPSCLFAWRDS